MSAWRQYLDEDFEDQYEKVERIKHKPKKYNPDDDRQDKKFIDKLKKEKEFHR